MPYACHGSDQRLPEALELWPQAWFCAVIDGAPELGTRHDRADEDRLIKDVPCRLRACPFAYQFFSRLLFTYSSGDDMHHFLSTETIDDLMHEAFTHVLNEGLCIVPTNGEAKELFGVLVELRSPRARVSRSQNRERVFSALGELLWYLSGSDDADQIGYYVSYYNEADVSVDGHVIGAYGPRLMRFDEINQVESVIQMLRKNPDSRNAVVQLFDHRDTKHAPCTLALQFVVRESKLVMMTSMRSNDLFWGLPHDLFAFTMIQEIIARSIGIDIGYYYHSV